VSVNAMADRATDALWLLMLNVKVVVLPGPNTPICPAPKALVIVGGTTAIKIAVEVFPVPATASITDTELTKVPATVGVTLTDTVHEPAAAKVTPEMDNVLDVAIAEPPHVEVRLLGEAVAKPAGNLSVKETLLSGLEAMIVSVRVVTAVTGAIDGVNDLAIVGGLNGTTRSRSSAMFPGPA